MIRWTWTTFGESFAFSYDLSFSAIFLTFCVICSFANYFISLFAISSANNLINSKIGIDSISGYRRKPLISILTTCWYFVYVLPQSASPSLRFLRKLPLIPFNSRKYFKGSLKITRFFMFSFFSCLAIIFR